MEDYDAIIVGGGIAGLFTAAFLTHCGRRVIVLEKHDKLGGYAASFEQRGVRFDIGQEGIMELAPESFLGQFLKWLKIDLPLERRRETIAVYSAKGSYRVRDSSVQGDFRAAFPGLKRQVDRFFDINRGIMAELTEGGAPKPPYEMSLFEKLQFGISAAVHRPKLLRYGLKNISQVMPAILGDTELIRLAAAKITEDIVYLSVGYRWGAVESQRVMYPLGGMRALPEAIAASVKARGSEILLRAEVKSAREEGGGRWSVDTSDGRRFSGKRLIVAAPMPWAAFSLFGEDSRFGPWRNKLARRRPFPGGFLSFAALDPSYDLGGDNFIVDWGPDSGYPSAWAATKAGRGMDPTKAPISCVVGKPAHDGAPIPLSILSSIGWGYASRWGTSDSLPGPNSRGEDWLEIPKGYQSNEGYKRIKRETNETILARLDARLGKGFREAIMFSSPATPLSFARYTNNPGGSYMGFSIRANEYGRFFPQQGPAPGLSFAGQWVFPGFGVSGVAASGYYLAHSLLAAEGTDLNKALLGEEPGR